MSWDHPDSYEPTPPPELAGWVRSGSVEFVWLLKRGVTTARVRWGSREKTVAVGELHTPAAVAAMVEAGECR